MPNDNNEKNSPNSQTHATGSIKISRIDLGEEIPQQFFSLYHWTPMLGASLVSGIYPYRVMAGKFEPDLLISKNDFGEMSGVPSWQYHKANYIFQKWNEAHQYSPQPVQPSEFLEWYSTIKVPPLGHNGKPLPLPTTPTTDPIATADNGQTTKSPSRANILNAVIQKATENATEQNDYQSIWAELVKMAQSHPPPQPLRGFEAGRGIKYFDGGTRYFSKEALKERIRRKIKKLNNPKDALNKS